MNGKIKILVGTLLVLAVLSVPFLAASALAAVNGTDTADQIQDQERIRAMDGSCDCDMLQTQTQARLGTHECEQKGTRQRLGITNQSGNCNCEGNLEQCRHQYRVEDSAL
jgi:hypothetical protein